ncbi:MAG: hypothetical protein AB2A00_22410, partial [Myxococcota bacterium]
KAKETEKAKEEEKAEEKSEEKEEVADAKAPAGMDYREYVQKRDAVEKAIAEDPTILKRSSKVMALYEKLHRVAADIRARDSDGGGDKKGKKAKKKEPLPTAVHERLKDAEVYEKTAKTVKDLHELVVK